MLCNHYGDETNEITSLASIGIPTAYTVRFLSVEESQSTAICGLWKGKGGITYYMLFSIAFVLRPKEDIIII